MLSSSDLSMAMRAHQANPKSNKLGNAELELECDKNES